MDAEAKPKDDYGFIFMIVGAMAGTSLGFILYIAVRSAFL
jgi:hypothetical protein